MRLDCVGDENFLRFAEKMVGPMVLFMDLTALFGIMRGPHCTISTNFYLYLQYFR